MDLPTIDSGSEMSDNDEPLFNDDEVKEVEKPIEQAPKEVVKEEDVFKDEKEDKYMKEPAIIQEIINDAENDKKKGKKPKKEISDAQRQHLARIRSKALQKRRDNKKIKDEAMKKATELKELNKQLTTKNTINDKRKKIINSLDDLSEEDLNRLKELAVSDTKPAKVNLNQEDLIKSHAEAIEKYEITRKARKQKKKESVEEIKKQTLEKELEHEAVRKATQEIHNFRHRHKGMSKSNADFWGF